jgi:hypothetical protein
MNKIYATCIIGAVAWCAAAQACSPRLDGEPTYCPDERDLILLPREEFKGEIDIYEPMHWHQLNMMFQRNVRKGQIERRATKPIDTINSALENFWEQENGSNGATESEELL